MDGIVGVMSNFPSKYQLKLDLLFKTSSFTIINDFHHDHEGKIRILSQPDFYNLRRRQLIEKSKDFWSEEQHYWENFICSILKHHVSDTEQIVVYKIYIYLHI